MKNKIKSLALVGILPLLMACGTRTGLPKIKRLDTTDAYAVFFGVPYNGDDPNYTKHDFTSKDIDNIIRHADLYKMNKDGFIEKLKVETEKSSDDTNYKDKEYMYRDINDDYWYLRIHYDDEFDEYLINKKTGKAIYVDDEDIYFNFAGQKSASHRRYYPQDKDGNLYTVSTSLIKGIYITKIKINEEEEKIEYKDIFTHYSLQDYTPIGVDNDGNIAVCVESDPMYDGYGYKETEKSKVIYITNEGNEFEIETTEHFYTTADIKSSSSSGETTKHYDNVDVLTKGFWQGYDNEIYTNEGRYICKVVPEKNSDGKIVGAKQEPVCELEYKPSYLAYTGGYVYLDGLQEVYAFAYSKENDSEEYSSVDFYCMYGKNMGKKVLSVPAELADSLWFLDSGFYSSNDSIYFDGTYKTTRITFGNEPSYVSKEISGYFGRQVTYDNKIMLRTAYNIYKIYDFEKGEEIKTTGCQFEFLDGAGECDLMVLAN